MINWASSLTPLVPNNAGSPGKLAPGGLPLGNGWKVVGLTNLPGSTESGVHTSAPQNSLSLFSVVENPIVNIGVAPLSSNPSSSCTSSSVLTGKAQNNMPPIFDSGGIKRKTSRKAIWVYSVI